MFDVSMPPDQFWHCTLASAILFVCSLCSALFVVAMTFERFYSIIRPHKAASFNTVKRAKIIIGFIVIFSLVFNLPHLFITSYQGTGCINYAKIHLTRVKLYFFLAFILHFALPFLSLLGMNSVIIHVLRKRSLTMGVRSEGEGQSQGQGNSSKIRSSERQIYIMLLLVAFAFFLLNTPGYILVFYANFGNYYQSARAFAGYYLFYIVGTHLFNTNYGINFFLYVISGHKFRSDLLRLFNCKKSPVRKGSSYVATSVSTVQTSEPWTNLEIDLLLFAPQTRARTRKELYFPPINYLNMLLCIVLSLGYVYFNRKNNRGIWFN